MATYNSNIRVSASLFKDVASTSHAITGHFTSNKVASRNPTNKNTAT